MNYPPLYQYSMPLLPATPTTPTYPYRVYAYPYATDPHHQVHRPYHMTPALLTPAPSPPAAPLLPTTEQQRAGSLQETRIPSQVGLQYLPMDMVQVPLNHNTSSKHVYFHPQYPGVAFNSNSSSNISDSSASDISIASTDSCNTTVNSDSSTSCTTPGFLVPSSLSPPHYASKPQRQQLAPLLPHLSEISHFPHIQQQQYSPSPAHAPNPAFNENPNNDRTLLPPPSQKIDLSALTPIPGCMAYRHPLIPVIPSASGNTRKHTLCVSDTKTNSITEGPAATEQLSSRSTDIAQTRRMAFGSPTWTQKDDELLRHLKEAKKIGWRDISMYFPTRTINACQFRWRRLIMKEESRRKRELHKSAVRARREVS